MGNTNSRSLSDKNSFSEAHSRSQPNIRNLSNETEKFYFEQTLKLQKQFSFEKNLRLQKKFAQDNENFSHQSSSDFHILTRLKSLPDSTKLYQEDRQFNAGNNYSHDTHSNTLKSNKSAENFVNKNTEKNNKSKKSKKLNKLFKLGNPSDSKEASTAQNKNVNYSLSRSANRRSAMTKSLVIINSEKKNNVAFITKKDDSEEEERLNFNLKNRTSIGNRLSNMESLKSIDDNLKFINLNINPCVLIDGKNKLGSMELNKSIDLNESNLTEPNKFNYLSTRNSTFNSSSSGCSSGASSSNLSTSRRLNHRPNSSLSTWSTNKMSTPSPPPLQAPTRSDQKTSLKVIALKNNSIAHVSSLKNSSSTKSISSEITPRLQDDSLLANNSKNHLFLNGISNFSMLSNTGSKNTERFNENMSLLGYNKNKTNLVKCDSSNSFNSILVMKPDLNMLQSSISSTGVSSEASSISNSKTENNNLNYAGSVKLTKRAQNRFNKAKSESMYVKQPTEHPTHKSNKKLEKTTKKQRDSGILVDILTLNGSVNNLKTKFNNATSSLRNSFSVFNLRNLSNKKSKSSKRHLSKGAGSINTPNSINLKNKLNDESDLDIENDYENSYHNYNSHSEDDEAHETYNEINKKDFIENFDNTEMKTFSGKENKMSTSISTNLINTNPNELIFANSLSFNQNVEHKKQSTYLTENKTSEILSPELTPLAHSDTIIKKYSFTGSKQEKPNLIKAFTANHSAALNKTSTKSESNNPISDISHNESMKRINSQLKTRPNGDDEVVKKIHLTTNDIPTTEETRMKTFKAANSGISQLKGSSSFNNKTTISLDSKNFQSDQRDQPYSRKTQVSAQHKKIVVQASTNDLLNCFAHFISLKCPHLTCKTYINPLCYMNNNIGKRVKFEPKDTINWLRSADCALLIQGWQDIAFMNPVNVVFVYLLVRDTLKSSESVRTVYDLQCNIMACLYLAFSYMGNEISYPLKPFLIEENRSIFWQRTCDLMNKLSGNMLKINRDPKYFTELFYELKSYSLIRKSSTSGTLSQIMHNPNIETNYQKKSNNELDQPGNSIKIHIMPQTSNYFSEKYRDNPLPSFNSSSLNKKNFSSQNLNKVDIASSYNFNKKRLTVNEQSSSLFKGYEPNKPSHQVIFSSNEFQPINYCI